MPLLHGQGLLGPESEGHGMIPTYALVRLMDPIQPRNESIEPHTVWSTIRVSGYEGAVTKQEENTEENQKIRGA